VDDVKTHKIKELLPGHWKATARYLNSISKNKELDMRGFYVLLSTRKKPVSNRKEVLMGH